MDEVGDDIRQEIEDMTEDERKALLGNFLHLIKPATDQDIMPDPETHDWGLIDEETGQNILVEEIVPQRRFTPDVARQFLINYARTGRKAASARAAGISYNVIRDMEVNNDAFADMVEEARHMFVDKIDREVYRRGIEGWLEPVFNVKTGQLIGHKLVHSDKMLEMAAKKHDPEGYGNKVDVNQTVSGGVVEIPMSSGSMEEDLAAHGITIEYVKDDEDAS
jgi:hypothetical protein